MISYEPFLDYLYFNKLRIKDVQQELNISPRTLAKLPKGEPVNLSTIERICLHYDLQVDQVVEILPDSTED